MGSMSLSPHFLTRSISRLLGLVVVSWAFARVGVQRLSLRLPHLGVSIHSSSPAIGFHSSIFHGGGICTSPPILLLYPGLGRAQGHSGPRGGVLYTHIRT